MGMMKYTTKKYNRTVQIIEPFAFIHIILVSLLMNHVQILALGSLLLLLVVHDDDGGDDEFIKIHLLLPPYFLLQLLLSSSQLDILFEMHRHYF